MTAAPIDAMPWTLSHRADPRAKRLADRHYNRQNPDSPQFAPPGRCVVLLSECERAFWITSWPFAEYVKHRWPGAWVCSAFRSEGAGVASSLICRAIAATRAIWPAIPSLGLVTFLDRDEVQPIRVRRGQVAMGANVLVHLGSRSYDVWGWTWLKAGFRADGTTRGGLLAFRLCPCAMPAASPPIGMPLRLAGVA